MLDVHIGAAAKKNFSTKFVSLQRNGKLVVYTPVDPHSTDTYDERRSLLCPAHLENFWDQGNLLQTNRDKRCQIVAALDLQYLFPGTKVFLREQAKELEVKIYKFERADSDGDDSTPYGFSQQWEKLAFMLVMRFESYESLESWFTAINELLSETTQGYFELGNRRKEDERINPKIRFQ